MNQFLNAAFTGVAGLGVLSTSVSAAAISWQPSVDLYQGTPSGPAAQAFVDTSDDFVLAFNGTSDTTTTAATVNGVVFTNVNAATLFSGYTAGGVTVKSSVLLADTGSSTFSDGSFSGDSEIFNLLSGAVFGGSTVTFSGLTPGTSYRLQVITNDARTNNPQKSTDWEVGFSDGVNTFASSLTAGTAGRSELNNRDPATFSGETAGDYIIGTFVADATGTQAFEIAGTRNNFEALSSGQAQINGLQLRALAPAVPEPGSLALLSLGGVAVLRRRRRSDV